MVEKHMTKKEKEIIKKEFQSRKWKLSINRGNERMNLKEFEKWDKLTPAYTPIIVPMDKVEVSAEGLDEGILSEDSIFETKLWYLRNHSNFDLSMRNGRRLKR